jgi:hypothetical protein
MAPPPVTKSPKEDPRLTVQDVERITRMRGMQIVAQADVPGAGPGLNFVNADRRMVLMIMFGKAEDYRRARAQNHVTISGRQVPMHLFHASVPGIGDEAFDSPPGSQQFALYLRKGDKSASLTTYLLPTGKMALTIDQLKMLGAFVAPRL